MPRMTRNEAVRAQVRIMMADGAGPTRDADALADAVVKLVLEAMGVEPSETGDDLAAVRPGGLRASTRQQAAARASTVVERLEPLAGVARAAERYRKAVGRRKGEKKARRKLFVAVEAWQDSRPASSR